MTGNTATGANTSHGADSGHSPSPLWGALFVVAASVLWGTTGTAATFAPGVSPLAIGAVAMGVGGLLQALSAARAIRRQWSAIVRRWRLVTLGALAVAVYPLAFYSSMHLSGVAVGTVVSIGSAPLAAALIERFTDHKALTRRWMVGALLGVGGAALLSFAGHGPDAPAEPGGAGSWASQAGILLGLLAGATYALYSWAAHRIIGGITSRAAMGSMFGLGGLLLMPVLAATGAPLLESWTNVTVGAYMALVPMFAGYVLFGWGLARVRASTATSISLLETVVAAVLAVLVVGERLPALGWLGAAVVLGSLFILTPRPPRPEHTARALSAARTPPIVRTPSRTAGPGVRGAAGNHAGDSADGVPALRAVSGERAVQQQAGSQGEQQDANHDGGELLAAEARGGDGEREQAHQ